MNGTNIEPFRTRATSLDESDGIEHEVGRLAQSLAPAENAPEPIALRMITDAELAAKQVEDAAAEVQRIAAAVAAEGRELAATMRKNAEAFEAQVNQFAEFAKGVTINIREAASSASTFTQDANA